MNAIPGRIAEDGADREIVLTHEYDAPRELVFAAWCDPAHVAHWWGPDGFTLTTHAMDVRPGGVWRFTMHGPDGTDYFNEIRYQEVVPPERLVFEHGGSPDGVDVHFHQTVTFEALGGRTRLTMRSVFATAADRAMVVAEHDAIEGGRQTLARLAGYLAAQVRS